MFLIWLFKLILELIKIKKWTAWHSFSQSIQRSLTEGRQLGVHFAALALKAGQLWRGSCWTLGAESVSPTLTSSTFRVVRSPLTAACARRACDRSLPSPACTPLHPLLPPRLQDSFLSLDIYPLLLVYKILHPSSFHRENTTNFEDNTLLLRKQKTTKQK